MADWITSLELLPPELPAIAALSLVAISFLTSALTAAIGIGGGVAMLAALASLTPPATALPVHGVVQIGSNFGRAALMRQHRQHNLGATR